MDAMGTAVLETRFRGCSQALLYNGTRPHRALGNRTPMAVWRDGMMGELYDRAVDMMDNARALPTCPQPQQQHQQLAA
jgi:putative transposase